MSMCVHVQPKILESIDWILKRCVELCVNLFNNGMEKSDGCYVDLNEISFVSVQRHIHVMTAMYRLNFDFDDRLDRTA